MASSHALVVEDEEQFRKVEVPQSLQQQPVDETLAMENAGPVKVKQRKSLL